MFKKEPSKSVPTDINQIILTALSIVRVELQNHGGPLWFKNIYIRELTTKKTEARK